MKTVLLSMLIITTSTLAFAQTATKSHEFDVSDGHITDTRDNHLVVDAKEMRATLNRRTGDFASIQFTYLGPTKEVSHLGDGEVRHQFGIKLRAQDICNLVYAMWNFDKQKIVVSVKHNQGMSTSKQCHDNGYHFDDEFTPTISVPPPHLIVDQQHTMSARITGNEMVVSIDRSVVWKGTLLPIAASYSGPVGIRSDNVHVIFDYLHQ